METGGPSSESRRRKRVGEDEGGGPDRISDVPDAVLGDIISLLPTKEGARTRILASRWRHLWRSAPLNLDCRGLVKRGDELAAVVSRILSSHTGPRRRFFVDTYNLSDLNATVDVWLRSTALKDLQELDLCYTRDYRMPTSPLSASIFCFSATLRVVTLRKCNFPDGIVQVLHFPLLKQLGFEFVCISESSLDRLIAGCPVLESLLIHHSYGFRCVRINSHSIRSIGVRAKRNNKINELQFEDLIIQNAPCLERLLNLDWNIDLHISILSAPKLMTFGYLYETSSGLVGSIIVQGLYIDILAKAVSTVKSLAVYMSTLSLDMIIELMRCFPCLEMLYVRGYSPAEQNVWGRKHQNLIGSRLKSVVVEYYKGYKSDIDFVTFFVLNARLLELMTIVVRTRVYGEEFLAKQRKKLQLEKRASGGAHSILQLMVSAVFGTSNMSVNWI
ncbi:unnamed protein product [Alopecurus aequalis]